jgi:choline kinase
MTTLIKSIILAAGEGKRLRPYTLDNPKCLVELGGKALIHHQIHVLKALGICDITLVTGYLSDKISIQGFHTIQNPDFMETNMVASLMCAENFLNGSSDILITYADIVYEPRILESIIQCPAPFCTAVDKSWLKLWQIRGEDPLSDAETLKMDSNENILELGKKPETLDDIEAQFMGLIKISAKFAPQFVSSYYNLSPTELFDGQNHSNMYMTSFLQHLIDTGHPLRAVPNSGGWLEIDTANDLEIYKRLLEEGTLSEFYSLA